MKQKSLWIIVLCLLGFSIYGVIGYKIYNWYLWREPEYESTTKTVLLSGKVDRLNQHQEDTFWQVARNIAEKELELDSGVENDSLRVEKTQTRHVYRLFYTCKGKEDGEAVSYDTEFYFIPDKSLKSENAKYRGFTAEKEYLADDY